MLTTVFIEALKEIKEIEKYDVSERVTILTVTASFKASNKLKFDDIKYLYCLKNKRDNYEEFNFQNENEEEFNFNDTSEESSYLEFISDTLMDQIITLKIKIKKNIFENTMTIYDFNKFIEDLCSLSINETINTFSDILKNVSYNIIFETQEQIVVFNTETMYFTDNSKNLNFKNSINRNKVIEKHRDITSILNPKIYNLIPNDFNWVTTCTNTGLRNLFDKIKLILSISFISNTFTIGNENITCNISGQKNIAYSGDILELKENNNFYRLYNWIYSDGSHVDKCIISRNIISIHYKPSELTDLSDDIVELIYSNYNLYLKPNADKFIESKAQISNTIIKITYEAREYANKLLSNIVANIVAIFAFIITIVLTNMMQNISVREYIFSSGRTTIFEIVGLGSIFYAILTKINISKSLEELFDTYEFLKIYYTDIFSKKELHQLFEKYDIEAKKASINKCKDNYFRIWILIIILFLVIIELSSNNSVLYFIKSWLCKSWK